MIREMQKFVENLDGKYKWTILSTFFVGIFAHGYMLMNKISFHDDVYCLFELRGTYSLGRWGLGVIQYVLSHTVGKYSMPLWAGVISLFFIAMSACMIIDLLEIEGRLQGALVGAIMVVSPAVTIVFCYMFTAGSYFFALFLSVLAVWLMERHYNFWGVTSAVICISFSLGIYQAYYCVGISIVLLLFLREAIGGGAKSNFKTNQVSIS